MIPGPHKRAADENIQSPEAPEPLLIGANMQCARGQGKKDRSFRANFRRPCTLSMFNQRCYSCHNKEGALGEEPRAIKKFRCGQY
jgi:hypothetical protein